MSNDYLTIYCDMRRHINNLYITYYFFMYIRPNKVYPINEYV